MFIPKHKYVNMQFKNYFNWLKSVTDLHDLHDSL